MSCASRYFFKRLILVILGGLTAATSAFSQIQESSGYVVNVVCNQTQRTISVGLDRTPDSSDVVYTVDYGKLLLRGAYNKRNAVWMKAGSKVAVRPCGPYRIAVSYGFLNGNPMGELGAVDFPMVQIFKSSKPITNKIRFEQCDQGLRIFKECPRDYATQFRLVWNKNATLVKADFHRQFIDASGNRKVVDDTQDLPVQKVERN